jgi:hypothetical protein
MATKRVSGRRVYITFIKGGTIVVQPSNCTGNRYRMRNSGSVHLPKKTSPEKLGKIVFEMRDKCKTT